MAWPWSRVPRDDGQGTVPGRLVIVAVRVDELPVAVAILPAHCERDDMVDFQQIVQPEVQSTVGAPPLLPVEQLGYPFGQFGVAAEPAGPIDPVAVVGALLAPNLHVPL